LITVNEPQRHRDAEAHPAHSAFSVPLWLN
jgi:hypothetical protein